MLYARIDQIADVIITKIHADSEFKSVLDDLLDSYDVDISFAHPGNHIPDIERENRILQERFRVNLYQLTFRMIPQMMIHYLAL